MGFAFATRSVRTRITKTPSGGRVSEQVDRHVRSSGYRTLLSVMDLSAVQPEVRFDTVVETAAMELIEAMMKRRQAS